MGKELMSDNDMCPEEIAEWNCQFYGLIRDLVNKRNNYTPEDINNLRMWFDYRKKLEEQTNCPASWRFSQFYFVETIEGISKDLADAFKENINQSLNQGE
jgi:hypothetical protein